MTVAADYAAVYEAEFRPRRRARRLLAYLVWGALLMVRPRLALEILRERSQRP